MVVVLVEVSLELLLELSVSADVSLEAEVVDVEDASLAETVVVTVEYTLTMTNVSSRE